MVGLTFKRSPPPPPLEFKDWKPVKGKAVTYWLPDDEFEVAARKHGISTEKDGFAIWSKKWWVTGKIYLRASWLEGFAHEAHHIETKSNFHKESS